jgi:hypothetical protein
MLITCILRYNLHSLIAVIAIHMAIAIKLQDMPMDHSPGPNRFNGRFLKDCWSSIKPDFYGQCHDSSISFVQLCSNNGSYINLIPKKDCSQNVNYYYMPPFSFWITVWYSYQEISQPPTSHRRLCGQYGFLQGKTIHDCLAYDLQFLHTPSVLKWSVF